MQHNIVYEQYTNKQLVWDIGNQDRTRGDFSHTVKINQVGYTSLFVYLPVGILYFTLSHLQ